MQPSEVRARVLSDHRSLRRDLESLERLVLEVLQGIRRSGELLRAESEALLARLRTHMHWEESFLLPALRDADAWGRERAERLVRDHVEQRELLDFVVLRLTDPGRPARAIADDVSSLIELLRDDMHDEEAELLDERVLRDDLVGIDVEAG